MINYLVKLDPKVQAAIISAIVSIVTLIIGTYIKYIVDKYSIRHKLDAEYEYEQRKKLRELIGYYHGRILESAERLNHRLWNLYENETKGWLASDFTTDISEKSYYFSTTIYRFIQVLSLVRQFEKEAVYIDSRIADDKDLEFVKFLKSLQWVSTDGKLFDGLDYDISTPKDHFFSDDLRMISDLFITDNKIMSLDEFRARLRDTDDFILAVNFFYDLKKNESRLRWDRIVSFHLVLMAFINSFGYDMQKSDSEQFICVSKKINNLEVIHNLFEGIKKLGLNKQKELLELVNKLKKVTA